MILLDKVEKARPLKRTIQQQLENPLAQEILAGRFGNGDVVKVDGEGGKRVFGRQGSTRNVVDFEACAVSLLNCWRA